MAKDFSKRCDNEAKAIEMLEAFRENQEWGADRDYAIFVSCAFKACWSWSLPLEQIKAIAGAIHSVERLDEEKMKKTLSKMVRAKALRSRVIGGVRHWEVNY